VIVEQCCGYTSVLHSLREFDSRCSRRCLQWGTPDARSEIVLRSWSALPLSQHHITDCRLCSSFLLCNSHPRAEMSQFGGSQHHDAAQGPYGSDNPPPPPLGKPNNKRDHPHDGPLAEQGSTSKKGPGRAYLHRKLNSRQRKNRKEHKAASNSAQDLRRSRSPSRTSQGSST
jgi:hypothetical protein